MFYIKASEFVMMGTNSKDKIEYPIIFLDPFLLNINLFSTVPIITNSNTIKNPILYIPYLTFKTLSNGGRFGIYMTALPLNTA